MDRISDWDGALAGMRRGEPTESLAATTEPVESGTSTFLGPCESGRRFWIKAVGNPQGDQVLVSECVVPRLGCLIDAPVRESTLVDITPELTGTATTGPQHLRAGVAHGSLDLPRAQVSADVLYASRGENRVRVPALAALWDWCLGADEQWMYDPDGQSIWSFDHGLWIGQGFDWDASDAPILATQPHPWAWGLHGTEPSAFADVANRLEAVTAEQVLEAVAGVPASWPVADQDLEALCWVVWQRRKPVADRLRAMAPRATR